MLKAAFLLLAASGLPVAIALLGAVLLVLLASGEAPPSVLVQRLIGAIEGFPVAVPFFVLTGQLMNNVGTWSRIHSLALALVGWLRGGLGQVNVVSSAIFAGMSGTVIADAAGLGKRQLAAMRERGYPAGFSAGVTAASATLGSIIPPSLPFLIYGMIAGVSIPALFLAGIVPGLLIAALMVFGVARHARRHGHGADVPFSRRRFVRAATELAAFLLLPLLVWAAVRLGAPPPLSVFVGVVLVLALDRIFRFVALLQLVTPLLLVGGMTSGLFTPTESAIAACAWAMFLGFAWYRSLPWLRFVKLCLDTVEIVGGLFFFVGAAVVFNWMLETSGAGRVIAVVLLAVADQPWSFLLLVNLLLLVVGCFLDPIAAIALLVPVLLPLATGLGIDPVHFGLMMVLNLLLGLLHPPAGAVLAVLTQVEAVRAIRPWLLLLLASLAVVAAWPSLSLWLPRLIGPGP